MAKHPGRLISFPTARKLPDYRAAVYGFPLGAEELSACLERIKSTPQSDPKVQEVIKGAPYRVMFRHLEESCEAVLSEKEVTIMVVHYPGGLMVLALVACTKPNEEFVPKQEELDKVANVLAGEGFADKPGWFWVRE